MLGYLDPGTGSAVAAIFASGAAGLGVAWRILRQRFRSKVQDPGAASTETEDSSSSDGA